MYKYAVMVTLPAAARLRGRNVLTVTDLGADELTSLLALAQNLKARGREQMSLLRGKTLAMLFEKPSLRTRVSFEVAMTQLGGHAIAGTGGDFGIGTRETPEDAARVLSRYADAIVYRTHAPRAARALRRRVDRADRQRALRGGPPLPGLRRPAHDPRAVRNARRACAWPTSATRATTSRSRWPRPPRCAGCRSPSPPRPRTARGDPFLARLVKLGARARRHRARLHLADPRAVRDVDVVYTDVWTSMGQEQFSERNAAALLAYQVDAELMRAAAPHALFMHCLPAHRGEEVTAEVIDGPQSVVFDQAENRLHAQKALLLALLTDLRGLTE